MKLISSTEALERLPGDRLHHDQDDVVETRQSKWSSCDDQVGLSLMEETNDDVEATKLHESIKTICSVMARFPELQQKQEACMAATRSGCYATEDAVHCISMAMRTFPDAHGIQKAAVEILKNVPHSLRQAVLASGTLDLTVATMCNHPDLHDDGIDIIHRFGCDEE